jgi:hypothetical protein
MVAVPAPTWSGKDREQQTPQRTGRKNSSGKMHLSAKLQGREA